MNEFRDFTSLPPEEEAQFIVYEQRTQFWSKRAMKIGIISAAIFGFLMVVIVFSHEAPENLMAEDDIGMLGDEKDMAKQRKELKTDTPAPAPAPAPAPTPEAAPEATPEGAPAPGTGGAAESAPAGAEAATPAPATP